MPPLRNAILFGAVLSKTFDFVSWLLAVTNHFPRSQRFVVTKRLLDANVRRGRARLGKLDLADAELDKVQLYLRLAFRWQWLSKGQYGHAARYVTEMGKLLGSWKKGTRQTAA